MKFLKNPLLLKTVFGIGVTFSAIFLSASAANAVSFVLKDGSNKAINVWLASDARYKFDGYPRAFVLTYNPNDREQRFDELNGNHGGKLYRVEGTNLCLNNGYNRNGAPINVWPCNPNDRDQNWRLINLGDSIHLQNVATGRCADSPSRGVSPNNFYVWDCMQGNRNQQFNVIGGSITPPPPPPPPSGGPVNMSGLQRLLFGNTPVTLTGDWGQRLPVWCKNPKFVGYVNCAHTGLDFGPTSRQPGAPIYSPVEGVVIRRSDDIGAIGIYNQKSNITFFLAHMNTTSVTLNQRVARGQIVGTVGSKGYGTGVHLHLEARSGRNPFMALDVRHTIHPLEAVNKANQ
jgi:murein DD-endopeptidase MepM/ murein hydrolase activator NlpD